MEPSPSIRLDPSLETKLGRVGRAGLIFTLVSCIGVSVGWITDIGLLRNPLPGAPVKLNMAIGLGTFAVAALYSLKGSNKAVRMTILAGALVALWGALFLIEDIFRISLGIDEFLLKDLSAGGDMAPGRPAPQSALILVLLGVSLMLRRTRKKEPQVVRNWAALLAIWISFVVLIGHATSDRQLYLLGRSYAMPVAAALLTFTAASSSLLMGSLTGRLKLLGSSDLSGRLFRTTVLPLTICLPLLGGLSVWFLDTAGILRSHSASWLITSLSIPVAVLAGMRFSLKLQRAEDDLLSEHERFQVFFEQAPLGALILDVSPDGLRFADANRALTEMLGYDREELLRLDPNDLIPPEDQASEMNALFDALANDDPAIGYTARRVSKDQALVPVQLTAAITRTQGDRGTAIALIQDITERVETEASLRLALALAERRGLQSKALAELARFCIGVPDRASMLSEACTLGRKALDAGPVEILEHVAEESFLLISSDAGRPAGTVMVTDQLALASLRQETAARSDPVYHLLPHMEADLDNGDSIISGVWIHDKPFGVIRATSVLPGVFDEHDHGFVKALANLLSLGLNELASSETLRTSERMMNDLIQNSPGEIYVRDVTGKILMANGAASNIFKKSPAEVLGKTKAELHNSVSSRRSLSRDFLQLLKNDESSVFEESRMEESGLRHLVTTRVPLHDLSEEVIGVADISTDVTQILEAKRSQEQAWRETLMRIVRAVEYRDDDTGQHVARVAAYSKLIAEWVGWDEARSLQILAASPLHDAGKIAIPDAVLLKPGRLTDEEHLTMQSHCRTGYDLLSGSGNATLNLAASIALTHHEWFDGTGYPQGLRGEVIPEEGRIVAVADVFDALTTDRIYRPAFSLPDAVKMMRSERGTHFDPLILDAFLQNFTEIERVRLSIAISGSASG